MSSHFADRLLSTIDKKRAPVCVGLDPLIERIPQELRAKHGLTGEPDKGPISASSAAAALCDFGREIIDLVAEHVPAIKINIAFFERYYADGVRAYLQLVQHAQSRGLLVIGDVKRADIGHSTTQYALAQLASIEGGEPCEGATPDAVTVNPYFGIDGVSPFLDVAHRQGRGVFVLVQTSNESAASVQGLAVSDGQSVCQHIGAMVQKWAAQEHLVGERGYSCVGAVVSPRDIPSTERIRALMPACIFLVPGFGAQGRTAEETAKCFKDDGTGALVTASRSVIYAIDNDRYASAGDWRRAVDVAVRDLVGQIRAVLGG